MDTTVQRLPVPGGHLALTLAGDGPLVVTSPGMGDLRTVFRDVAAPLVEAGYRVACVELRGHGDSSTTFTEHGLRATARDLLAVVEHLGGPAVLVGASCSAGSAAIAAAERPELVHGLVLLDPHLPPDVPPGRARRLATRAQVGLLRGGCGSAAWASYYRSLHAGRRAAWFDQHLADVRGALRDRGHMRSFGMLARTLVREHLALPIDRVTQPTLVVHGALDPEFSDPAAELGRALAALTAAPATGLLVPEAGHYPHSQRPDVLVPALLELLAGLPRRADVWARA